MPPHCLRYPEKCSCVACLLVKLEFQSCRPLQQLGASGDDNHEDEEQEDAEEAWVAGGSVCSKRFARCEFKRGTAVRRTL